MQWADAHCDALSSVVQQGIGKDYPAVLREYQMQIQVFAAYAGPQDGAMRRGKRIMQQVKQFQKWCEEGVISQFGKQMGSDIPNGVLALEDGQGWPGGAFALSDAAYYGVKIMGMVWNDDNSWAGGCLGSQVGLTQVGKSVIKKAAQLRMAIDVSHMSKASFWDSMNHAQGAVMASHSACDALFSHPRNLTNDQLHAIIDNGGFIGIPLVTAFLGETAKQAGAKSFARHVAHIASLGGIANVGLGSDFFGSPLMPQDVPEVSMIHVLERALIAQGFSKKEICAIAHDNLASFLQRI